MSGHSADIDAPFPVVTLRVRRGGSEELTGYWRESEWAAMEQYIQARENDDRDPDGYRVRAWGARVTPPGSGDTDD